MAVIVPEPEHFTRIMAILVELSGDAKQIKATTDTPTLGLVVSDELYDKYLWHTGVVDVPEPEPVKRRPGRPRKIQPEVQEAPDPASSSPDPVPVFQSAPTGQEDSS